jgi:uncharacterized membrane protein YjgN (DUF898 family)
MSSHPVLAAVIAVPLLVIGLTVAYQVGDYLDPAPLASYVGSSHVYGRDDFQTKVGRGVKMGVVGVGLLVLTPVALILYLISKGGGGHGGGGGSYGD